MMDKSARTALHLVLVALVMQGACVPLAAQEAKKAAAVAVTGSAVVPAPAKRPWLYENSDVPIDTAWLFGTLPNGLRYAIRKNGVPPGQISIRLRMDAGSLMERADEAGYAHFMEHLTFRGSKHVPDGESKRIWQRLGVTFGSDSNAQTTPTGTTYALDLPDATKDSIDESLKILAGMMSDPNIIPSAVDAERAVVLAEMREGTSANSKAGDAVRAFIFAGQPLATRSPIGTADSLNAASAKGLQAFHDRWYRPENAVISIAGDFDPAQIETLLKRNFAGWKAKGKPVPAPDFGKPDPQAPVSAVVVQPGVSTAVSLSWLRPWKPKADTIVYNQNKLADMVALQIINRRLEQAARDGKVAFLAANANMDDISRSVDGTFVSIAPSGSDWREALKDVRAIIEDAKTTAPSEQEITREYNQFDTVLAISVENEDSAPAAKQAEDLVSAVDIRETTVSSQAALDIFRSAKAMMTPLRMLEATRRMFSGDTSRAMLTLPAPQIDAQAKLAQDLATPVAAATGVRLAADAATIADLPKLGSPGKIVSRTSAGVLGVETITYSNGVKLNLFANDAETGKVRINVRFGNGLQAFSAKGNQPSWAAPYILPSNGIGKLTQRDLDAITNGRRLGINFGIDENAFELSALTRPADYQDQLRLLAAKLAAPGWDASPIERIKSALLATYDNMNVSPSSVMERDLGWLLRNKDARFRTPDKTEIAGLTPQAFRKAWEPLLASGPVEVQIFGDVKTQEAIDAVAATFGALSKRKPRKPQPDAAQLSFPAHNDSPLTLYHAGDSDQAAATIAWPTGVGVDNAQEARQLDVLAQIISDRLFEKLRAVDGAAYSPSAVSNYPLSFSKGSGYLLVSSQLKPDKVAYFYKLVSEITQDLATKPVAQDELNRTVAPMRQMLMRASTGNAFWMTMLEGASYDNRYIGATRNVLKDMVNVTAADLEKVAAKFLVSGKSFSVQVLPERAQKTAAIQP
jgi:zinc protease